MIISCTVNPSAATQHFFGVLSAHPWALKQQSGSTKQRHAPDFSRNQSWAPVWTPENEPEKKSAARVILSMVYLEESGRRLS